MKLLTRATRLALIAITIISSISISAQSVTSSPRASIAVTLAMAKDASACQSPCAILSLKNLTGEEIIIHDDMYRVYVEGDKGEPPTTLVQRQKTGRLKPEDVPLRSDEYVVWTIAPKESGVRKFQLAYLYDLSAPGKYTVYAEAMDPSSKKWLRTNTVEFKVQAVAQ